MSLPVEVELSRAINDYMSTLQSDLYPLVLDLVDYNDPAIWQVRLLYVCKRWYAILSARSYKVSPEAAYRYSLPAVMAVGVRASMSPNCILLASFIDRFPTHVAWESIAHNQPIPAEHVHRVNWPRVSDNASAGAIRHNSTHLQWERVYEMTLDEEAVELATRLAPRPVQWHSVFARKRPLWFTLRYGWRTIGIDALIEASAPGVVGWIIGLITVAVIQACGYLR